MLNDASGFSKIYIATGYTDLRRGIDGLAGIIKNSFKLDPFQKNILFLFCGRKTDRIKGLIWEVYMSTENSVNRSLKTRSLLTKFGTCSIAATGAVTTLLLFRSRFHCAVRFRGVCRNRLPYQSDKLCM